MSEMKTVNLRAFRRRVRLNKGKLRRFLTKLEKNPPKGFPAMAAHLEQETWKEVDCLSCANCCKTMTPTFKPADIKRISAHLGMTTGEFKEKWLRREKGGDRDWLNKSEPCQFLNPTDNSCSIYEVRPSDCAGFPHLTKHPRDFAHVHKQNVECCPATYKLVEKMMMHFGHTHK